MFKVMAFAAVLLGVLSYRYLASPPSTGPPCPGKGLTRRLNKTYDYIIVGSGSAGAVLAARLSEDRDVTVLLLEAGPDDRDYEEIDRPDRLVDAITNPEVARTIYPEKQKGLFQGLHRDQTPVLRGVVLGGSSSINFLQYVRGSRHDFDRWADYTGDVTWDYSHVVPYFIRSEGNRDPRLVTSPYHGQDGPLKLNIMGNKSTMGAKIVETLMEAGLAYNEDYNGKSMEGVAYTQINIHQKRRSGVSKEYLHPILERPNLHVSVLTFAQRVLFDGKKRALGVEIIKENRKMVVKANREVILSAGALQTPQLLMLSGVGPRAHLEKMGIPIVADLPVGQNLQDHALLFLPIFVDAPLTMGPVEESYGVEVVAFSSTTPETKAKDWPDVELNTMSGCCHPGVMKSFLGLKKRVIDELVPDPQPSPYAWVCLATLLRPKSVGNITLASTDPFDDPLIHGNYLDDEADTETLLRGVDLCKRAVNTKAMREIGGRLWGPKLSLCDHHKTDSREYWLCYTRAMVGNTFHHVGSCRMGAATDPQAVLDTQLRVKALKGLRVVDASVMPYITSGNTHTPIVMIAEKAADMIRGREPPAPMYEL